MASRPLAGTKRPASHPLSPPVKASGLSTTAAKLTQEQQERLDAIPIKKSDRENYEPLRDKSA